MKTKINSSVKRVLSLVIAFALLIGTLFTANVGININANADEATVKTTIYYSGNKARATSFSDTVHDGSSEENAIIIYTAEELAYLASQVGTASQGKFYKMADNIGTIVLQAQKNATDILALTSSANVKTYFDNLSDKYTWGGTHSDSSKPFVGTFDGNGVEIYGLYSSGGDYMGLFPAVDSGTTIKNVAVKNSYINNSSQMGAIVGRSFWNNGGLKKDLGNITIDGCTVANCYLRCSSTGTGFAGVVSGYCDPERIVIDNCLVYGNDAKFGSDYSTDMAVFGSSTNDVGYAISITNSLILGTTPYRKYAFGWRTGTSSCFSNVYTDQPSGTITFDNTYDEKDSNGQPTGNKINYTETYNDSQIKQVKLDQVKGINGKKNLGLDWAVDGDTAPGKWYVRADDYPTLSYPGTDWKDIELPDVFSGAQASNYQKGTGTKDDPYIIKTTAQLFKMVNSGAEGQGKYFKVDDSITEFYLSDIRDSKVDDLTAVKSVYNSGNYSNWAVTGDFYGHFDGNGVTIKGMICKDTGAFVKKMCKDASIENVNFSGCYAYGSTAAIVCKEFAEYGDAENKPTISGISVRYSHIESTCTLAYETGTLGYSLDGFYTAGTTMYKLKVATAGGIVATTNTPKMLTILDCLYDGTTCELTDKGSKGSDKSVVTSAVAGILSVNTNANNFTISNCVSLGAPIVTSATHDTSGNKLTHVRYGTAFEEYFENCYSDYDYDTYCYDFDWDLYPDIQDIFDNLVDTADQYEQSDFLLLDFANKWEMKDFTDNDTERTIPMPKCSSVELVNLGYANYSKLLADYNGHGLTSGNYPTRNGNYGWYEDYVGTGTENDPYIIDSAEKLALAIATGGSNAGQKLYYKLSCDINLGGVNWIDTAFTSGDNGINYTYTAFAGTLDGNGHTVSGLYSVTANRAQYCGLIPILNGGTVKNLHLRDSYIANSTSVAYAGGIVGENQNGTIIGCSAENTLTSNNSNNTLFASNQSGTTKNSYYVKSDGTAVYYINNATGTPDLSATENGAKIWYQVTKDSLVRLTNRIKLGKTYDLDGNGTFDTNDIAILRNSMLGTSEYTNAYADINGDGVVNIIDLALVRRESVIQGDKAEFVSTRDGFWANVELGKVSIYYDCNDNYDSARKLQLYIESVYPTVSITKYTAGTVVNGTEQGTYNNQDNAISIKKDTSLAYDKYNATYDYKTNVLKINGGSFTAVEQAVLDLIAQKTHENKSNPQNINTLSILNLKDAKNDAYKSSVTVNGTTYYYAWGDEFESGSTYSADTWKIEPYRTETNRKDFAGLESPEVSNLSSLWVVENGRLTIKRGVNTDVYGTSDTSYVWSDGTGYVGVAAGKIGDTNKFNSTIDADDKYIDPGQITTVKSMVFKQGYAEMRASLPSDGHAFPAWWLLGNSGAQGNANIARTLYGKIYKLNNAENNSVSPWDGKSNSMVANDLTTYKYQVPNAYLEFDIVELMQSQNTAKSKVGDWKDYIQLTVHKIYDQNVYNKNLYVHNWATGTVGNAISLDTFNTTTADRFIHRYSPKNTIANYMYSYETGALWWKDTVETGASFSFGTAKNKFVNQTDTTVSMTNTYTYGFAWTVNGSQYELTIYIDFNNDGNMSSDEIIFKIDQNIGHNDTDSDSYNSSDPLYNKDDTSADAEVWDQYMYMLLDNSYYTANYNDQTSFNDLFKQDTGHGTAGAKDKTTFDIDYVRVYQQDGKRDLVTAETEAFNTGSHFGY